MWDNEVVLLFKPFIIYNWTSTALVSLSSQNIKRLFPFCTWVTEQAYAGIIQQRFIFMNNTNSFSGKLGSSSNVTTMKWQKREPRPVCLQGPSLQHTIATQVAISRSDRKDVKLVNVIFYLSFQFIYWAVNCTSPHFDLPEQPHVLNLSLFLPPSHQNVPFLDSTFWGSQYTL